jgi:uncharacterized membrane protein
MTQDGDEAETTCNAASVRLASHTTGTPVQLRTLWVILLLRVLDLLLTCFEDSVFTIIISLCWTVNSIPMANVSNTHMHQSRHNIFQGCIW